jgi:hypothetical protein
MKLLCPMLVRGLAQTAVYTTRRAVLKMTGREMGLCVRYASARDRMLVVVLAAVGSASMLLMMRMVVVLMVLVVLERLP